MKSQSLIQNVKLTHNTIDLSKTKYKSLQHLIPDVVNKVFSFELKNSNRAIANAIKRTLVSEVTVRYLTVSLTDIHSTDPCIVDNPVHDRIEMIAIPQDTPLDATYSIRFENKSDTYVDVLSSEIKQRGKPVNNFIQSMPICSINSGHTLVVDNIKVAESCGYVNGRFSLGRIGYKVLDHDMKKNSSQNTEPTHFQITLELPGNIDEKDYMCKAIDSIIERLDAIDYTQFIVEFGVYKLFIPNETFTIGNLLSWYIYALQPDIDFVAARMSHPSKRECTLDIKSSQAKELCEQAVVDIKKELTSIKKSFT